MPGSNGEAVRHLLARGFPMADSTAIVMANRPVPGLDRFIPHSTWML